MAKTKATVYLDDDLWQATKVVAARSGRDDSQVLEDALRRYLGLANLEAIWARTELSEEEALDLAYREVHAARAATNSKPPVLKARTFLDSL